MRRIVSFILGVAVTSWPVAIAGYALVLGATVLNLYLPRLQGNHCYLVGYISAIISAIYDSGARPCSIYTCRGSKATPLVVVPAFHLCHGDLVGDISAYVSGR